MPPAPSAHPDPWQLFGSNLIRGQKAIWLFPLKVARGHHVKATLAVAGIAAALVGLDPLFKGLTGPQAPDVFNRALDGQNTYLGTTAVLPAFYLAGLVGRSRYARNTAVLATEALLDADAVSLVMEDVTRRLVPSQVPVNGDITDTWFDSYRRQSFLQGAGGFPSGHTIAAFAVATVIARRYPHPLWHQWVAYGLAGLVGASRLSTHSHFPSDVFLGATLGYAIARFVVTPLSRIPH
ncbi:MAG: phosphatase PAP2 family protein [Acidobacteriota bacterium]|nr:phosphatase PAP2 family protein [Acidobacteriota bacterium]